LVLRAVARDGRELRAGGRTSKGAVGYDLVRLLVGSDGPLALITQATLRLLPAPERAATLRACYARAEDACAAVARVMVQPAVPRALEFLDAASMRALVDAGAARDLPPGTRALLLAEADGTPEAVAREVGQLRAALEGPGLLELRAATDAAEVAALWSARRALSRATKAMAPLKINEDVVVPVPKLAALVALIERLAGERRLRIVSFGHAGNGNLHVNLRVDPADAGEMARAQAAL